MSKLLVCACACLCLSCVEVCPEGSKQVVCCTSELVLKGGAAGGPAKVSCPTTADAEEALEAVD